MTGIADCCARAAIGQATAAPPTSAMNSRRCMVHDLFLFEVKKPSESKKPWDYYKQACGRPGRQCVPLRQGQRVSANEVRRGPA
jgi:hypothetical protein